eukprot:6202025-Pleurochrysis_carterae.AAC.1
MDILAGGVVKLRLMRARSIPCTATKPATEVAWESVVHVSGNPQSNWRVQYRHECEMRDPHIRGCTAADETLAWR